MSNKPTPEQLIGYLYGELSGEEKVLIEKMVAQSPELAEEIQETRQLLAGLRSVPEAEAPPPPALLVPDPPPSPVPAGFGHPSSRFFSPFVKGVAAVAASLVLVMVAGALTQPVLQWNHEGLSLRFGSQKVAESASAAEMKDLVAGLRQEIQSLKREAPAERTAQLHQELVDLKQTLVALHQQVEAQASRKKIPANPNRSLPLTQSQMNQLLTALSNENLRLVEQAFLAANEQQQRQLQEALTNFARYLDQIREADTEMVLSSLEEMDRRSEIKFRQTDQAIDALLESLQARNSP